MLCVDVMKGHFVVDTFKGFLVISVPQADEFITDLLSKLEIFFQKHPRGVLLEMYFYRTYSAQDQEDGKKWHVKEWQCQCLVQSMYMTLFAIEFSMAVVSSLLWVVLPQTM